MNLGILIIEDRKRIKRNLLGLCGRETVKSIREIVAAMMPPDYNGYVVDLENEARKIMGLGRMHYSGDKFLSFVRITDKKPTERYRIKLENTDSGWGSH